MDGGRRTDYLSARHAAGPPGPVKPPQRPMPTFFMKLRLPVTRAASVLVVIILMLSRSAWEEARPEVGVALFSLGVVLVAIASMGRMWCSVYIAGFKDQVLITKGPYSLCRNPLYFFSTLGALGIGFCTETFTFPAVFLVFMALYYPGVIREEERRLRNRFGKDFDDYVRRVPSYFPKFSLFDEPEAYAVNPRVYRRHVRSAIWFVWIVGWIEICEGLSNLGWIKPLWAFY